MSQKNCSLAIDEENSMVQEEYEASTHYEPELRVLVNAGSLHQDMTNIEGRIQVSF